MVAVRMNNGEVVLVTEPEAALLEQQKLGVRIGERAVAKHGNETA